MNVQSNGPQTSSRISLFLVMALGMCGVANADSKREFEAGLKFSDQATAADVGLPAYPNSKPYLEEGESGSGANIGLSFPGFGIKVHATKLETADKPEKVAAFYLKALSKYGKVIECKYDADAPKNPPSPSEHNDQLKCDANDASKDSIVYKTGTKKNQRVVSIKPYKDGTRYSMAHVDIRE